MNNKIQLLTSDWQAHKSHHHHHNVNQNNNLNLAKNYKMHKLKFKGIAVRIQNAKSNTISKVNQLEMYKEVNEVSASKCCFTNNKGRGSSL